MYVCCNGFFWAGSGPNRRLVFVLGSDFFGLSDTWMLGFLGKYGLKTLAFKRYWQIFGTLDSFRALSKDHWILIGFQGYWKTGT